MTEVALTFDTVDWTKCDQVRLLFPIHIQEKAKIEGVKGVSNTVDICPFTLETPFKDQVLLKDTSLFLEPYKRHCLFGSNGTGKTLLFERMADYSIKGFPRHLNVHHCKEMEHKENAENVLDTVVHSHEFLGCIRKCDAKVKELRAEAKDDAVKLAALDETTNMLDFYMRQLESDLAEEKAQKMLRALGFDEHGMSRSTNDLSGGLRTRVALAVAFFADADLLLLDEPTNHLDFPSVLWLENRLRGYSKSFLLVTHDRDLLCNVTTSTLLLEEKQIKYYPCGFGEFEKRKAKEDEKKDKEVDKFLQQNRNADPSTMTGKRVHDYKTWQAKYHERMVLMAGKFTFPKAEPLPTGVGEEVNADGSTTLIKIENCRFTYSVEKGLPYIFDDPIDFKVTTTSRIGIMGPNGAGKSTLLKLLTQKIVPTEGKQSQHPNFILAYFGQHSTAELVMEQTPTEFMQEQFPTAGIGKLREHLKKTGVANGSESTRMMNLSYSQRSCVIFAKLTFICPHLLIMDEPTNFLDIDSVDALVNAANKFPGALLVVTHSRGFLRKCAKSFLSVVPGKFEPYEKMKDAEEATYSFMRQMEGGVKIDASQMAAGGGSLHAKKVVDPNAPKFEVGETVEALWTDKKYHEATVLAIVSAVPPIKYTLKYPEFDKNANVPEAGVRKFTRLTAAEVKEQEDAAKALKVKEQAAAQKKAAAHVWAVGEKCMTANKNGQMCAATIKAVNPFDMFTVEFEHQKGDFQVGKPKLRFFDAALATAPAPAAAAGGGNTNKGKAPAAGNTNKGQARR